MPSVLQLPGSCSCNACSTPHDSLLLLLLLQAYKDLFYWGGRMNSLVKDLAASMDEIPPPPNSLGAQLLNAKYSTGDTSPFFLAAGTCAVGSSCISQTMHLSRCQRVRHWLGGWACCCVGCRFGSISGSAALLWSPARPCNIPTLRVVYCAVWLYRPAA
jgi:hypothetical protein